MQNGEKKIFLALLLTLPGIANEDRGLIVGHEGTAHLQYIAGEIGVDGGVGLVAIYGEPKVDDAGASAVHDAEGGEEAAVIVLLLGDGGDGALYGDASQSVGRWGEVVVVEGCLDGSYVLVYRYEIGTGGYQTYHAVAEGHLVGLQYPGALCYGSNGLSESHRVLLGFECLTFFAFFFSLFVPGGTFGGSYLLPGGVGGK